MSTAARTEPSTSVPTTEDEAVLPAVVTAVQAAGRAVAERFSTGSRLDGRAQISAALAANDEVSLTAMRETLLEARPGSRWSDDELVSGSLPPGEWWVTDPVEGNVNHGHGIDEWCVTATLVRDSRAVLTVVDLPTTAQLYTAVRGRGAYLDGVRLRASQKTELSAALVGTGQAMPGESSETYRRIGASVTAMLHAALVVRVSVPATLQLLHVAAGRADVFWQYSNVLSGLLAGALLVEEAGGSVTDTRGRAWTFDSPDLVAAAPGVHAAAVAALATTT